MKGPGHPLLRIADDDFGSHLFPTEQEEAERKGIEGTIEVACELLGIELGVERRSSLAKLDLGALKELLGRLRTERRWPGS